jgi:Pyruvate/2-oxoacid:ferredoxin oxidoreductase delta subunit
MVHHVRSDSAQASDRRHATYTFFSPTSTNEKRKRSDLLANRKSFAVHSALRMLARSCTECSEFCTEDSIPVAWGTAVGVIVVDPSGGCRFCTALVVCERSQGEGTQQKRKKSDTYGHGQDIYNAPVFL